MAIHLDPGLTLARSYRQALALRAVRGWPASHLVYLSEDDYLFRPEAFTSLAGASCDIPEADYFAFYASTAPEDHQVRSSTATWQAAETTTSSFGARTSALAADRWMPVLGCRAGFPAAGPGACSR